MRWLVVLLLSLGLGACGYIPFSGGKLEGTVTEAPTDWSGLADADIIQLETNPAEPYSVKLWVIGMEGALYVHAGANRATWVEHIEDDSRVRMKIGDAIFELEAAQVSDADEFRRFSDIYEKKYGNRPRNENIAEVYLYRLTPRA